MRPIAPRSASHALLAARLAAGRAAVLGAGSTADVATPAAAARPATPTADAAPVRAPASVGATGARQRGVGEPAIATALVRGPAVDVRAGVPPLGHGAVARHRAADLAAVGARADGWRAESARAGQAGGDVEVSIRVLADGGSITVARQVVDGRAVHIEAIVR